MFEQLKIDPRQIDDVAEQATKLAKDSFHATVGLAAKTADAARDQWETSARRFEAGWATGKDQVAAFVASFEPTVRKLDQRFASLEDCVGGYVERATTTLPEPVAKVAKSAFEATSSARAKLFDALAPRAPEAGASTDKPEQAAA